MAPIPMLTALMDPRGRTNRKGLLVAAGLLLAAELVIGLWIWMTGRSFGDMMLWPIKALLLYMAVSAAVRRIHDIGLSAWRLLGAFLVLMVWSFGLAVTVMLNVSPEQMAPGQLGSTIVTIGIAVPMVGAMLWLHFAPGKPKPNEFGPVPTGLGFSESDEQPRSATRTAPVAAA